MANNVIQLIEGWVWCETEGEVHEDVPDPHENGPMLIGVEGEPGWQVLTDHAGFSGTYWHYTCPGPHHWLRKARQKT